MNSEWKKLTLLLEGYRNGSSLQNKDKGIVGDVGSETTYLHLKGYGRVIPQSYRLKVL